MTFVNLSLMLGGLLVGVPIVLHLVMRRQPQKLVFPALRFVQQRRQTNQRTLQVRHLLLLLLRCLAIALLALTLMRPSVPSAALGEWLVVAALGGFAAGLGGLALASYLGARGRVLTGALAGLAIVLGGAATALAARAVWRGDGVAIGNAQAPVGAAIVVDTSPRMQYETNNRTRLTAAQEMAVRLVEQLPAASQVAVLDAQTQPAVFAVDLGAATQALKRLRTTAAPRPLGDLLRDAIELVAASDRELKEVYVLTDRTQPAWEPSSLTAAKAALDAHPSVALYLLDVGGDQPHNVALGDLRLAAEAIPRDGELALETTLHSDGIRGQRVVELAIEEPSALRPVIENGNVLLPELKRRDQQVVTLTPGQQQVLRFRVRGLPAGVHQGQLRVLGRDSLAIDDQRYFTVSVQPAWPVLVVAPGDVSTTFLTESIAPWSFRESGKARFEIQTSPPGDLQNRKLDAYAAVCLLDPPAIPAATWQQLAEYTNGGGSVLLALGRRASVANLNGAPARQLLPGEVTRQWRASGREVYLVPANYSHPVTRAFRDRQTSTPWDQFAVFRHWGIDPGPESQVLISFSGSRQPALLEHPLGRGRVLTLATSLSDTARTAKPWNELTYGENNWPPFVLINELMLYLVRNRQERLNYLVGETAVLANSPQQPERYQLFTPREDPQEVTGRDGRLVISYTNAPGAYRLKGDRGGLVIRGFSANLPEQASDLRRVPLEQLEASLGAERFQFARDLQALKRKQGSQRIGTEFFPLLLLLVACTLAAEYLLANRFYRKPAAPLEGGSGGGGGSGANVTGTGSMEETAEARRARWGLPPRGGETAPSPPPRFAGTQATGTQATGRRR